jgi:hypothetical protein
MSSVQRDTKFSPFLQQAAVAFCNCMFKNYISEVIDVLHESRKRAGIDKSCPADAVP